MKKVDKYNYMYRVDSDLLYLGVRSKGVYVTVTR